MTFDACETTTLGYAVADRFAREYAIGQLGGEAFSVPACGMVWDAIVGLHTTGRPVNVDTIVERARTVPYNVVSQALTIVEGWTDVQAVDELRERCERRRVRLAAQQLADRAVDMSVPFAELRAWSLDPLRLPRLTSPPDLPSLEELVAGIDGEYDWLVPGILERGDRVVLVAAEGHGKSVMLRQWAHQSAAGVHWFTGQPVEPCRALILDTENSPRQIARSSGRMLHACQRHQGYHRDNLRLLSDTSLDLCDRVARDEVEATLEQFRPDLVILGPIYKTFSARSTDGWEENALRVVSILDEWRSRFGVTILIEHHAAKGPAGSRDFSPVGSSVWMRWPEFGLTLRKSDDGESYAIGRFRGDRDVRPWPRVAFRSRANQGWLWVFADDERYPG